MDKQVTVDGSSLRHMFDKIQCARPTRTQNELLVQVPFVKTEVSRKAYSYRGPSLWNTVPADIKLCETVNSFKTAYTAHRPRDANHPG